MNSFNSTGNSYAVYGQAAPAYAPVQSPDDLIDRWLGLGGDAAAAHYKVDDTANMAAPIAQQQDLMFLAQSIPYDPAQQVAQQAGTPSYNHQGGIDDYSVAEPRVMNAPPGPMSYMQPASVDAPQPQYPTVGGYDSGYHQQGHVDAAPYTVTRYHAMADHVGAWPAVASTGTAPSVVGTDFTSQSSPVGQAATPMDFDAYLRRAQEASPATLRSIHQPHPTALLIRQEFVNEFLEFFPSTPAVDEAAPFDNNPVALLNSGAGNVLSQDVYGLQGQVGDLMAAVSGLRTMMEAQAGMIAHLTELFMATVTPSAVNFETTTDRCDLPLSYYTPPRNGLAPGFRQKWRGTPTIDPDTRGQHIHRLILEKDGGPVRGGGGSASIVVTISRDVWLVEALVQGYNSPASVKEAVLWKSFDRNALGLGARTDGHQSVTLQLGRPVDGGDMEGLGDKWPKEYTGSGRKVYSLLLVAVDSLGRRDRVPAWWQPGHN